MTTATNLRKDLFRVLEAAMHAIPTRIRYKKDDAVILSYSHYQSLFGKKNKKSQRKKLLPPLKGTIHSPLNEKAEIELMKYLGL